MVAPSFPIPNNHVPSTSLRSQHPKHVSDCLFNFSPSSRLQLERSRIQRLKTFHKTHTKNRIFGFSASRSIFHDRFYLPPSSFRQHDSIASMWQRSGLYDDPFTSPAAQTPSSRTYKWANRARQPSRFSGPRFTPLRTGMLLLAIGILVLFRHWIPNPTLGLMVRHCSLLGTYTNNCRHPPKPSRSTTPPSYLKLPFSLLNPVPTECPTLLTLSRPTSFETPATSPPSTCMHHSVRYATTGLRC